MFVSNGGDGWLIDEPGYYSIQACLHLDSEDFVSNPLEIRVAPPRTWEEQYLAQDYFSDDVGRVLTFDGSQVLDKANDTLQEVAAQLANHKVTEHALIALNFPRMQTSKVLVPNDKGPSRYRIKEVPANETSIKAVEKVLVDTAAQSNEAAITLGHIDYGAYAEQCAIALQEHGNQKDARDLIDQVSKTFKARKVLQRVIDELEGSYGAPAPASRARGKGARTRAKKKK